MMKRLTLAAFLALALTAPASALNLLNVTVTTAVTASVTPNFQIQSVSGQRALPVTMAIQCKLTYGSGGTSATVWVQTSLDGGATWIDVANCSFTTQTARFLYNLSGATPVTTQYTPTDGTLTANSAHDGNQAEHLSKGQLGAPKRCSKPTLT
jgi:hypothetical protein